MYKDDPRAVSVKVDTIIVNDDYNYVTTNNDIALFQLKIPVQLNDVIDTVCLPQQRITAGDICYVTGFGEVYGIDYIIP